MKHAVDQESHPIFSLLDGTDFPGGCGSDTKQMMTEDDKEEGDGMGVLVMCCCITSQSQARLFKPTHMYFLLQFPGSGIWVVLVPFLSKMWSRCQPGLTGATGSSAKVTPVIVDRQPQLSMLLHGVVFS